MLEIKYETSPSDWRNLESLFGRKLTEKNMVELACQILDRFFTAEYFHPDDADYLDEE